MLFFEFVKWWYSAGWKLQAKAISSNVDRIMAMFSTRVILQTFFNPWRQIVTHNLKDTPLDEKLKAIFDNALSRVIGAIMRSIILIITAVTISAILLYRISLLLVWPILPTLPIIFLIIGAVWR